MAVVDPLELVEVEQHHRQRFGDAAEPLVQCARRRMAVGKAGQCIGIGHPLQFVAAGAQFVAMLQRAAVARVQQRGDHQQGGQADQHRDRDQALAVQAQGLDVVVALQELAFRFGAFAVQAGFQQGDPARGHVDRQFLVQRLVRLAGFEGAGGIAGAQLQLRQQVEHRSLEDAVAEVAHVGEYRTRFLQGLAGAIARGEQAQPRDVDQALVAHRDVVVGGGRFFDPAFRFVDAPLQQAQFRHPGEGIDAVRMAARKLGQADGLLPVVFGVLQFLEPGEGADQLAVQGDRLAAIAFLHVIERFEQVAARQFLVVEVAVQHAEHAQAARGLGLVAGLARHRQRIGMHGDRIRETPGAPVEVADGVQLARFHRAVADVLGQRTRLQEQFARSLEIPQLALQHAAFVQPQRAPASVVAGLDHRLHLRQHRFGVFRAAAIDQDRGEPDQALEAQVRQVERLCLRDRPVQPGQCLFGMFLVVGEFGFRQRRPCTELRVLRAGAQARGLRLELRGGMGLVGAQCGDGGRLARVRGPGGAGQGHADREHREKSDSAPGGLA